MTDIAASIGIQQMKRAEEFRISRKRVADRYTKSFSNSSALTLPFDDQKHRIHAWHLYPLRLNLEHLRIDRAEFIKILKEYGISCSVHWIPLHMHPYYRQTYKLDSGLFPNAEKDGQRLLTLPIFPSMTDEEIQYVIDTIHEVVEQNAK